MGRARARVVWSGVDRLELSSTAPISPTEVQRLRAARAGRGATKTVTIADDRFEVKQRRGSHGAIRLVGENMTVALRPDAAWQRPTVSIEIGAFALACLGPDAAVMRAGAVLDGLTESQGGPRPSPLHVSRIDLAADVQGWTVSPKDCTRLVSKGRLRDGYRGQGHFTGFTVGKGPLQARIYDKVREIAEHGGAWQSERWARSPHRRPGAPVWRVEVQLRREKLRSYARTKGGGRLDTWEDVRPVIPSLWRHVTETWASFRLPRTGRTRLRRNALRIATLIEYGGPLQQLEGRETMVPCKQRPARKPCPGLMWVMKRSDDRIEVFCMICRVTEAVISGWQDTEWAEGPMQPAPMTDD